MSDALKPLLAKVADGTTLSADEAEAAANEALATEEEET